MKVRPFALSDLKAAARFCEGARERDPAVEPFGDQLAAVAKGERARLSAWRVLEGDAGELRGIGFAAARDEATVEVYAAVDPRVRRRGFGRALIAPSLGLEATLRVRVMEKAAAGRAFLAALGFAQVAAQLSLQLEPLRPPAARAAPALCGRAFRWWPDEVDARFSVRPARREDEAVLRRLSNEAWAGAPGVFAPRPEDEVLADDRVVWLAERKGHPAGYVAARKLGSAIAIEELAVLPAARRLGIGRELILVATEGRRRAVLWVAEDNAAARAFYASLGFAGVARRLVYEKKPL